MSETTDGRDQPMDGDGTLGIRCPRCGCRHHHVIDTTRQDGTIRRKRRCRHCGRLMLTYERPQGAR